MRLQLFLLGGLCIAAAADVAAGQRRPPKHHRTAQPLHSGFHDGDDVEDFTLVYDVTVTDSGAVWTRLEFGDYDLGQESFLLITSHANGDHQSLTQAQLDQWSGSTALFHGEAVQVELYAAKGEAQLYFELESTLGGEWNLGQPDPTPVGGGVTTLCLGDDRVSSGDNRVGRIPLIGCTAWRVMNGAFLTAGHCVDLDPDGSGSGLPDGTVDLGGVVEFNVPSSQSDGTMVPSAVVDQFPIDTSNISFRFDGSGQGFGKDWGVFGVFPNSLGQLPHERYGLPLRITTQVPGGFPVGELTRVTGFGTDTTPLGTTGGGNQDNQTNQTSTGAFGGEFIHASSEVEITYAVDTEGGNSGSPVIWEEHGVAVGIHTNGGCITGVFDANRGTGFEANQLENAVDDFVFGSNARHLDPNHPLAGAIGSGRITSPFTNFFFAQSGTPSGGTIVAAPATYDIGTTVLEDPIRIVAPVGGVIFTN